MCTKNIGFALKGFFSFYTYSLYSELETGKAFNVNCTYVHEPKSKCFFRVQTTWNKNQKEEEEAQVEKVQEDLEEITASSDDSFTDPSEAAPTVHFQAEAVSP